MYVKGVSKVSQNGNRSAKKSKKRHYVVYYFLEDGSFHTQRIKWYEVPFYKAKICKQKSLTCEFCEKKFTFLIKKNEKPQCPNCLES